MAGDSIGALFSDPDGDMSSSLDNVSSAAGGLGAGTLQPGGPTERPDWPQPDVFPETDSDEPFPPLSPSPIREDPDHGELFPGLGPDVYHFDRPADVQHEQGGGLSVATGDPYANDCTDRRQPRIRVVCDSGVLTRVTIYNGRRVVSKTENVGTGMTAPPIKSYCGDFTRVKVDFVPGHATFHFSTNAKLT